MSSKSVAPLIAAVLALGLVAGLGGCSREGESAASSSAGVVMSKRPDFTLTDTDGVDRSMSDWDGQVVVVNFWATWCPPCRREIPHFIELQAEYGGRGLQFVGIGMDSPDQLKEFARGEGINYPVLTGEDEAIRIAKEFGNDAALLPYSAVVDRDGRIVFTLAGEFTRERADQVLAPLL